MQKTKFGYYVMNRRAREVFDLEDNEMVSDIYVDNNQVVHVKIVSENEDCDYMPAMEDRPQALDYLLGNRDDFND